MGLLDFVITGLRDGHNYCQAVANATTYTDAVWSGDSIVNEILKAEIYSETRHVEELCSPLHVYFVREISGAIV